MCDAGGAFEKRTASGCSKKGVELIYQSCLTCAPIKSLWNACVKYNLYGDES